MIAAVLRPLLSVRNWPSRVQALILLVAFVSVATAGVVSSRRPSEPRKPDLELSSQAKRPSGLFVPTMAQWANLTVEPVEALTFRSELITDGKIAVDDDRATPIFSPY